jgi:hypothetical protein
MQWHARRHIPAGSFAATGHNLFPMPWVKTLRWQVWREPEHARDQRLEVRSRRPSTGQHYEWCDKSITRGVIAADITISGSFLTF